MKKCAFPHARHIYSLENYFTGGRCRLAWRVLTLADENYRGEPHEVLVKCLKNFVYPWSARRKKKVKFRTVFQNILFIGQFMNCFIAARGKNKIETRGVSVKWIPIFFNKKFVSSFFPVNLSGGQFFVTAEDRHLWNVSETHKEFTLPVIFSSVSQQRNRHW